MSAPERTADGRYIVVGGRKWRASDPDIPEGLRSQLVEELMDARRCIAARDDEAFHRRRVHDAKVALGERGRAWWEPPDDAARADRIAATIRTLLRRRGRDKTVCPSEIARIVAAPDWRPAMPQVRSVSLDLHAAGLLDVTKQGVPVRDPSKAKGAIRYRATRALLEA